MSNTIVLDAVTHNGQLKVILPEAKIALSGVKKQMTKAPLPREEAQGYRWAPWGANDCLPTEIRRKIEKVPMASQAVYRLIAMMYGNGLAYYRNDDLKEEEQKVKRARIPLVENWLRRNKITTKWLIPQFADYRYTMNTFSEMAMNRRRDEITNIYHKPGEFCRLSKQNESTLNIDNIFFSPDFSQGYPPIRSRIKSIPLLPWYESECFLRRLRKYNFAYHSRFETPGITYYARPFWIGLFRKNGWIDVSIKVPEVVNAMMSNQVILKYQILIPESYFEIRHEGWQSSYTDVQRNEIIDKKIDEINDMLQGTDNLFKSISTVFKQDPVTGADLGKIEIIAIDDKTKKDEWVPSSDRSDAQIVQSLGLHPSQVGLAPEGGKMGAGSGSDQRESFNTQISINTIDQEIVLEPLNFIAEYNARGGDLSGPVVRPEWDITFLIDHTHHTTTNNQESGMEPSDTTLIVQ